MKLIVLGANSPFPAANGGTSGYLLQTTEGNILIDCGSGVLSYLHNYLPSYELDGVIISHTHADHITDLNVLKYAIDIPIQKKITDKHLYFYGPEEHEQELKCYQYKNSLVFKAYSGEDELSIAGTKVSFCKTIHSIPCYAMKIIYENLTIVYTADTEYSEELISFAKDADFLIAESTMLDKDIKPNSGHLSAKQAAMMASNANVKQLLLTHLWPYYDDIQYLNEAQQYYTGPITIAERGQEYYIK
ncbi:MBL fold metallo-hydrolase [Desulfuribacillus alkaliarsenatis]|uniref:Metallo-beta-lactamase domain-containing protein n=1 Tax=Desulfuribacillus alkaliarsenatis TaxID=766136 RepID=A0A1E5FZZ1_9FIRM|nr:MBL fold metallo-hydrolase [Desulfuribacillus alkaliarsenatis]OEF96019.1 hypothetical protein BHF68_09740 [Desulfuribacillus alkaliarsenatis]